MDKIKPIVKTVLFKELSNDLQKKVTQIHKDQEALKHKGLDELEISFSSYPLLECTLISEWNKADTMSGEFSKGTFLLDESINLKHLTHFPYDKCFLVERIIKEKTGYGFVLCEHSKGEQLVIYRI